MTDESMKDVDLVERLRSLAASAVNPERHPTPADIERLSKQAADEIERLRKLLPSQGDVTVVPHQDG
jgi:hypothetical protein